MSDNSPKDGKTGSQKARARSKEPVARAKGTRPKKEKPPAADTPVPTEPKELKNENPPRPTKNMEVHHHPDLHHEKKPWKEYMLEGLMILLAVFMGFIAENIRESIDNNEHARQLTSQLVRDLKADTMQLTNVDREEREILKANDSLFNLLQQPLAKVDTKKIQKLIIVSHNMWPFQPSLGAISAIKNEMHLKQFANSEMIGYIANYEGHLNLLRTAQDINLQYQHNYLDTFLRLHFTPANLDAAFGHRSISSQMRNLTQEDLTQLSADMVLVKIVTDELIRDDKWCKDDVVKLMH